MVIEQQHVGGYRAIAGEASDVALPLPRRGLSQWIVAHTVCALVALAVPLATIIYMSGGPATSHAREIVIEGGFPNILVFLLHPILAIVSFMLGLRMLRGGRPKAPWVFISLALVPAVISIFGYAVFEEHFLHAATRVSIGNEFKLAADGFAEADAMLIYGSLASGCLCVSSALALLGFVLSVDVRRVDRVAAIAITPTTQTITRTAPLALAMSAFVLHVFYPLWNGSSAELGSSWPFAVVVIAFAAAIARPAFVVMNRLGFSETRNEPIDTSYERDDIQRVHSALFAGATLLVLGVFLLDRANIAMVDRSILKAIAGHVSDPQTVALIYSKSVSATNASSANLVIDMIVSVLILLPAALTAIRQPNWRRTVSPIAGEIGSVVGVAIVFLLVMGGLAMSRKMNVQDLNASANAARGALPDLIVAPPEKQGVERRYDVNVVVSASGEAQYVHISPNVFEITIAPDRHASIASLIAATTRLPSKGDSTHVGLALRLSGRGVRDLPSEYSAFDYPPLAAYQLSISSALDLDRGPLPTFVLLTSSTTAHVTCDLGREIFADELSFADPSARATFAALTRRCSNNKIVLAPMDDATVEDLYKMLDALPLETSTGMDRVKLTLDRAPINDWINTHPRGPKPPPPTTVPARAEISGATSLRQGATQVYGRLPPEVIQRIVRQHFGEFRVCYGRALASNPGLRGRVTVKFVIDRSGAVTSAIDGGSDLADDTVVQCILHHFGALSFPQPEGGIVLVVYPMDFQPG